MRCGFEHECVLISVRNNLSNFDTSSRGSRRGHSPTSFIIDGLNMNLISRIFLILTIPFLFNSAAVCVAQESPGGSQGITASGVTKLSLTPDFLVMTLQVEGSSSELAQAAKELDERVTIAQKRLAELKAIPDSISVSPATMNTGGGGDDQRMQQMMAQYGGGKKGKEMLEATKSVSVTQTITARWALPETDGTERLISVKELITKIEKADLGSTKRNQPVSDAQKELAAELEAMADEYSYGETPKAKSGVPKFSYVATLEESAHRDAIKSAFEDATASIAMIAEATGQKVGQARPKSMTTGLASSPRYNPYGGMPASALAKNPLTGVKELSSDNPSKVEATVTVQVIALFE